MVTQSSVGSESCDMAATDAKQDQRNDTQQTAEEQRTESWNCG